MDYSGMTVNERLVLSRLINDFDNAIKKKDKEKIIEILRKVELDNNTILQILKKFKVP